MQIFQLSVDSRCKFERDSEWACDERIFAARDQNMLSSFRPTGAQALVKHKNAEA